MIENAFAFSKNVIGLVYLESRFDFSMSGLYNKLTNSLLLLTVWWLWLLNSVYIDSLLFLNIYWS